MRGQKKVYGDLSDGCEIFAFWPVLVQRLHNRVEAVEPEKLYLRVVFEVYSGRSSVKETSESRQKEKRGQGRKRDTCGYMLQNQ